MLGEERGSGLATKGRKTYHLPSALSENRDLLFLSFFISFSLFLSFFIVSYFLFLLILSKAFHLSLLPSLTASIHSCLLLCVSIPFVF
jgi:hypothetical protein